MKILALMPDAYGGFGGIAQYNRDLLDALSQCPRVSRVVSLTRHEPDPQCPLPAKLSERHLSGSRVRYLIAALAACRRTRPDLILCGHIDLLPAATLLKRITGVPMILEAYGIEVWQRRAGLRGWGLEDVDLVIAISRFTREKLREWSAIEPHRIRLCPNAVRLERYSQKEKPAPLVKRHALEGKRVLLTVARLSSSERYKGIERILREMPKLTERFPDLIYLIVGDGEDRPNLERFARDRGVSDRVIFAGRIPEEQKIDYYNLADAFAMPSSGEGFGFVFLEAAACGLPVLGGGVDGSRDALVEGRLGVMIDPDDADELLHGLEEILHREKRIPDALTPFDFPRFSRQIEEIGYGYFRNQ